ncbi:MAG: lipid-A-disaccharide synthase [Deltaproteobacteria bacterium]|nr:MAG: lipid-A-disaccharide synthase [Deltaproteobacteria bacterium]
MVKRSKIVFSNRKQKTENRKPQILVVAGETSGDQHGARLVAAIQEQLPEARFYGIGGDYLARQGVEIAYPARDLAVVGLWEVAAKLPTVGRALACLWQYLKNGRPHLAILVDYPDFNFWVARFARHFGVPVLYYISPQVWAWRRYRVHTIARLVERMVVIFPFEERFYQEHGVAVTYVGHPLLETMPALSPRSQVRQQLGLADQDLAIALLPGSRASEIERLLPIMLAGAELVQQQVPGCRFVLPRAATAPPELINRLISQARVPIKIFHEQTNEVLAAADLAVVTSGTATLEAALWGTPMVIVYRLTPLSYQVGKRLIRVDHIGMVNLLAQERLFPELIQDQLTPAALAAQINKILSEPELWGRMRSGLERVITSLGGTGASRRAARVALELLAPQLS